MQKSLLLLPVFFGAIAVGCTVNDTTTGGPAPHADGGVDSGTSDDAGEGGAATTDAGGGDASPTEAGGTSIWPVITSNGGKTMAPFKLVTIVAQNDADATQLFAFGDAVGASQWWTAVAGDFALGAFAGHTKWTGPPIVANISDADMVTYIRTAITANSGPAPDEHTLYLLYLPDGFNSTNATSGEINTDCATSSGYHTDDGNGLLWSVVERCTPSYPSWTKLQGVTQTAAHEIAEAATDPLGSTWDLICAAGKKAWECSSFATATQGEVGDLCPETRWDEGGFVWSRIWGKNAAAAGGDPCLPKLADPYETATTAKDWYVVQPGATVTIPVAGWSSTGAAPDWTINAGIAKQKNAVFTTTFTATTLAVGQSADLTVTAPANAPSGSYAIVQLNSAQTTLGTSDPQHQWFVGVYVP